jgi:F-type H+-transporting ATPase subunit delta
MAEKATLARPYARASFAYARAAKALPAWSEFLANAATVVGDAKIAGALGNPAIDAGRRIELIAALLARANRPVDAAGRNFLALLAENGRLALLPEIAAQYETLRAEAENIVDVDVATALPLTPEQQRSLCAALKRRLGREVRLAETVDPALIGGAVVKAGDLVLDGSLKGRLERLITQMTRD